ncbi:hypothetical protein [Bradyrhizobium sp. SZCCHNS3002]|uniref:hypothetical protein n=1 Tax=Bradyrhizobium sp. SZCCHNS3002 TaxID=3057310 RepID=UPI0028EB31E8|nr:hypothetical protein [Bradyrhizobium sp. SZCCHNS3002]
MKICLRCAGARFVCEAHPDRPWTTGAGGCRCGAPGDPCPLCNGTLRDAEPPAIDPAEMDGVEQELIALALRARRRH